MSIKIKELLLRPSVIYIFCIIYSLYLKTSGDQLIVDKTISIYPYLADFVFAATFAPLIEELIFRYWIGVKRGWLVSITMIMTALYTIGSFLGLLFRYTDLGNANYEPLPNIEIIEEVILQGYYLIINATGYEYVLKDYISGSLTYGLSYLINALIIYLCWRIISKLQPIKNLTKQITLPHLNLKWQIVVSALTFSFFHLGIFGYYFDTWSDHFLLFTFLGLCLGFARVKHGIWAAVALHSLWNTIASFYIFRYAREDLVVYGNGYIRDYYNELAFYYIVLALTFTASISYLTYKTFFGKRIRN